MCKELDFTSSTMGEWDDEPDVASRPGCYALC